jgi:hypothetical protein
MKWVLILHIREFDLIENLNINNKNFIDLNSKFYVIKLYYNILKIDEN